jgi:zinc/manganese transport system substrate-binding protein
MADLVRRSLLLVLLLLPLSGLARRPHVVATLPDLAALCRQVAGERAQVTALLSGASDPILGEPQPDQARALAGADLLVALGGPLEAGWLPRLLVAARNSRLREYLEVQALLGGAERDTYPLGDPRSAAQVARAIAVQLGALDPAGASIYQGAASALCADLEQKERRWLQKLAPLRGLRVVLYDDSFRAFIRWAGLLEAATLSPSPGVPPTPTQVLRALRAMRVGGPRLILQRAYEPAHTVRLLREKAGAQVVVAPLGARDERGEQYAEGLEQLVQALLQAGRGS